MKFKYYFTVILLIAFSLTGCSYQKLPQGSVEHNMTTMTNHEAMLDNSPVIVTWSFDKAKIMPNENALLNIRIKDSSQKNIAKFDLTHEKLMHLIIVSEDLSYFEHIHPNYKGEGLFTAQLNFPFSGKFKLISEFSPKGYSDKIEKYLVSVDGDNHQNVVLQKDDSFIKIIDGKEVTLSFKSPEVKANTDVSLTFTLKDALSKKEINNLQPYLGTTGHLVVINPSTDYYTHEHSMEASNGPNVTFTTNFPKPGLYKIWGQVQIDNKVLTIPFSLQVN
jgi:hypothetical protein